VLFAFSASLDFPTLLFLLQGQTAMASDGLNRIITIGASAGGIESLRAVVSRIPADCRASIFVVLHIPPYDPSARLLAGHGLSAFRKTRPDREGAPLVYPSVEAFVRREAKPHQPCCQWIVHCSARFSTM
jgi:hypothetical protein